LFQEGYDDQDKIKKKCKNEFAGKVSVKVFVLKGGRRWEDTIKMNLKEIYL
jgi:hypothetical protein